MRLLRKYFIEMKPEYCTTTGTQVFFMVSGGINMTALISTVDSVFNVSEVIAI